MAVVYVRGPARSGKSAFGARLASEPDGTEFVLWSTGKPIDE